MNNRLFDRYLHKNSALHRLSPIVKVSVAVLLIASNSLLPDGSWCGFGISWGLLLLLNTFASLGWNFTLKRSVIALPFVAVALSALLTPYGNSILVWQAGSYSFTLRDIGVIRFFSVLLRAWLSVQVAALLVSTTPFPDLLHALEHLHIPKILVTMIAFLYRYLSVLSDEATRLQRARQARSAILPGQRGGMSLLAQFRVTGNLIGQLFLRSYNRAERIYQAMLARGYRGHIRTLNRHEMQKKDFAILSLTALWVLFLQIFVRLG